MNGTYKRGTQEVTREHNYFKIQKDKQKLMIKIKKEKEKRKTRKKEKRF